MILKKKKEIHAIGAEVWVKQPSGPPTPADVIAQGKDNTVLVMIPRQEKCAIKPLLISWIGYSWKLDCTVGCHSRLNLQGYASIKRKYEESYRIIFSWRNLSWTWTQDNFTCSANKACPFLILPFYGQNLSVC